MYVCVCVWIPVFSVFWCFHLGSRCSGIEDRPDPHGSGIEDRPDPHGSGIEDRPDPHGSGIKDRPRKSVLLYGFYVFLFDLAQTFA